MITVRPERAQDQAEIQNVRADAIATLRQVYRPNQRAIENKGRISKFLHTLVAVTNGRVVGTVQYYMDKQSIRVIGLSVHTDFRRKGVARSLIQYLGKIGIEENATRIKLHTVKETGNEDVLRRLGFVVVSEREDDLFDSDSFDKLTDVEMIMQLP